MDAFYVNYPSPVSCGKSARSQYNPACNFHASKYYGYRSLITKLDHYIVYFPFVFTLKSLFTYNHRLPYIYTSECACLLYVFDYKYIPYIIYELILNLFRDLLNANSTVCSR